MLGDRQLEMTEKDHINTFVKGPGEPSFEMLCKILVTLVQGRWTQERTGAEKRYKDDWGGAEPLSQRRYQWVCPWCIQGGMLSSMASSFGPVHMPQTQK